MKPFSLTYFFKVLWKEESFEIKFDFIAGAYTATDVTCYIAKDVTNTEITKLNTYDLRHIVEYLLRENIEGITEEDVKEITKRVKVLEHHEEDLREHKEKPFWIKDFSIKTPHYAPKYYRLMHQLRNILQEKCKKEDVVVVTNA